MALGPGRHGRKEAFASVAGGSCHSAACGRLVVVRRRGCYLWARVCCGCSVRGAARVSLVWEDASPEHHAFIVCVCVFVDVCMCVKGGCLVCEGSVSRLFANQLIGIFNDGVVGQIARLNAECQARIFACPVQRSRSLDRIGCARAARMSWLSLMNIARRPLQPPSQPRICSSGVF